ncbi:MAG: nucleotide-binding protein [Pseudomonadales bacterium]|nr:nucleotide-binding protein [Pseudomonadales bacterium]
MTEDLVLDTKDNKDSVFIVHGHDRVAKEEVARFIEKLDLKAVILHEQVSKSMTIIEKLENYTDLGFGIVLYTPCDEGRVIGDTLKPRARQNVVFEHGYLMAKLGRPNVMALVKGNIDVPGDLSGVVYEPMDDNGGWKIKLVKELKEADFTIDMSKM